MCMSILEGHAHAIQTWQEDMELNEAQPTGEKAGEVGVRCEVEIHVSL